MRFKNSEKCKFFLPLNLPIVSDSYCIINLLIFTKRSESLPDRISLSQREVKRV